MLVEDVKGSFMGFPFELSSKGKAHCYGNVTNSFTDFCAHEVQTISVDAWVHGNPFPNAVEKH